MCASNERFSSSSAAVSTDSCDALSPPLALTAAWAAESAPSPLAYIAGERGRGREREWSRKQDGGRVMSCAKKDRQQQQLPAVDAVRTVRFGGSKDETNDSSTIRCLRRVVER